MSWGDSSARSIAEGCQIVVVGLVGEVTAASSLITTP
jgi:hypothetical protein